MPLFLHNMAFKNLFNLCYPIKKFLNIVSSMKGGNSILTSLGWGGMHLCILTWGDCLMLRRSSSSSSSSYSYLEEAREGLEEARGLRLGGVSWLVISWRLACMEAIWILRSLTSWERLFRTLGSTSTSSSPLVWRMVSSTYGEGENKTEMEAKHKNGSKTLPKPGGRMHQG